MEDNWNKFNTWIHTKKMLLLIFAILVFFPIAYFLVYPNIGAFASIVIYFIYLIVVAILIRLWLKEK